MDDMEKHLKEIKDFILDNCEYEPLKKLIEEEGYIAGGTIRALLHKKLDPPPLSQPSPSLSSSSWVLPGHYIHKQANEINDYDIFFKTPEAADKAIKIIQFGLRGHLNKLDTLAETMDIDPRTLKNPDFSQRFTSRDMTIFGNFEKKLQTKNAITFASKTQNPGEAKKIIQLITKYTGSPEEVISRFDFTNSMGYYDFQTEYLHVTPEMSEAIKNKELVFNPECYQPIHSFRRINKFKRMDYRIDEENFKKLWNTVGKSHTCMEIIDYLKKGPTFY